MSKEKCVLIIYDHGNAIPTIVPRCDGIHQSMMYLICDGIMYDFHNEEDLEKIKKFKVGDKPMFDNKPFRDPNFYRNSYMYRNY